MKEGKSLKFLAWQLVITLVFFALVFSRGVFVKENTAINALETQGFTNIKVESMAWFMVGFRGCDGKDAAKFTVRATNPLGKNIELYVCSGWPFKGATIRTK